MQRIMKGYVFRLYPTTILSKIICIDLGIKDLIITSDGYTIENNKKKANELQVI